MVSRSLFQICFSLCLLLALAANSLGQTQPGKHLTYEGTEGVGKGKHIVFLAGDHEYRGEQTLPMLARILAKRHGFKCTVLFSVDKKTGDIVPGEFRIWLPTRSSR